MEPSMSGKSTPHPANRNEFSSSLRQNSDHYSSIARPITPPLLPQPKKINSLRSNSSISALCSTPEKIPSKPITGTSNSEIAALCAAETKTQDRILILIDDSDDDKAGNFGGDAGSLTEKDHDDNGEKFKYKSNASHEINKSHDYRYESTQRVAQPYPVQFVSPRSESAINSLPALQEHFSQTDRVSESARNYRSLHTLESSCMDTNANSQKEHRAPNIGSISYPGDTLNCDKSVNSFVHDAGQTELIDMTCDDSDANEEGGNLTQRSNSKESNVKGQDTIVFHTRASHAQSSVSRLLQSAPPNQLIYAHLTDKNSSFEATTAALGNRPMPEQKRKSPPQRLLQLPPPNFLPYPRDDQFNLGGAMDGRNRLEHPQSYLRRSNLQRASLEPSNLPRSQQFPTPSVPRSLIPANVLLRQNAQQQGSSRHPPQHFSSRDIASLLSNNDNFHSNDPHSAPSIDSHSCCASENECDCNCPDSYDASCDCPLDPEFQCLNEPSSSCAAQNRTSTPPLPPPPSLRQQERENCSCPHEHNLQTCCTRFPFANSRPPQMGFSSSWPGCNEAEGLSNQFNRFREQAQHAPRASSASQASGRTREFIHDSRTTPQAQYYSNSRAGTSAHFVSSNSHVVNLQGAFNQNSSRDNRNFFQGHYVSAKNFESSRLSNRQVDNESSDQSTVAKMERYLAKIRQTKRPTEFYNGTMGPYVNVKTAAQQPNAQQSAQQEPRFFPATVLRRVFNDNLQAPMKANVQHLCLQTDSIPNLSHVSQVNATPSTFNSLQAQPDSSFSRDTYQPVQFNYSLSPHASINIQHMRDPLLQQAELSAKPSLKSKKETTSHYKRNCRERTVSEKQTYFPMLNPPGAQLGPSKRKIFSGMPLPTKPSDSSNRDSTVSSNDPEKSCSGLRQKTYSWREYAPGQAQSVLAALGRAHEPTEPSTLLKEPIKTDKTRSRERSGPNNCKSKESLRNEGFSSKELPCSSNASIARTLASSSAMPEQNQKRVFQGGEREVIEISSDQETEQNHDSEMNQNISATQPVQTEQTRVLTEKKPFIEPKQRPMHSRHVEADPPEKKYLPINSVKQRELEFEERTRYNFYQSAIDSLLKELPVQQREVIDIDDVENGTLEIPMPLDVYHISKLLYLHEFLLRHGNEFLCLPARMQANQFLCLANLINITCDDEKFASDGLELLTYMTFPLAPETATTCMVPEFTCQALCSELLPKDFKFEEDAVLSSPQSRIMLFTRVVDAIVDTKFFSEYLRCYGESRNFLDFKRRSKHYTVLYDISMQRAVEYLKMLKKLTLTFNSGKLAFMQDWVLAELRSWFTKEKHHEMDEKAKCAFKSRKEALLGITSLLGTQERLRSGNRRKIAFSAHMNNRVCNKETISGNSTPWHLANAVWILGCDSARRRYIFYAELGKVLCYFADPKNIDGSVKIVEDFKKVVSFLSRGCREKTEFLHRLRDNIVPIESRNESYNELIKQFQCTKYKRVPITQRNKSILEKLFLEIQRVSATLICSISITGSPDYNIDSNIPHLLNAFQQSHVTARTALEFIVQNVVPLVSKFLSCVANSLDSDTYKGICQNTSESSLLDHSNVSYANLFLWLHRVDFYVLTTLSKRGVAKLFSNQNSASYAGIGQVSSPNVSREQLSSPVSPLSSSLSLASLADSPRAKKSQPRRGTQRPRRKLRKSRYISDSTDSDSDAQVEGLSSEDDDDDDNDNDNDNDENNEEKEDEDQCIQVDIESEKSPDAAMTDNENSSETENVDRGSEEDGEEVEDQAKSSGMAIRPRSAPSSQMESGLEMRKRQLNTVSPVPYDAIKRVRVSMGCSEKENTSYASDSDCSSTSDGDSSVQSVLSSAGRIPRNAARGRGRKKVATSISRDKIVEEAGASSDFDSASSESTQEPSSGNSSSSSSSSGEETDELIISAMPRSIAISAGYGGRRQHRMFGRRSARQCVLRKDSTDGCGTSKRGGSTARRGRGRRRPQRRFARDAV